MTERYTEFLVDFTGRTPNNLNDVIRKVQSASAGFIGSWSNGELDDAKATSDEAFGHLDYVQNELLRQRDVRKKKPASWASSPFKASLGAQVGNIVGVSPTDETWFRSLSTGGGAFPPNSASSPLALEAALNKLKHRDTTAVNFSILLPNKHLLYALTPAGMGQPSSLVEIDISIFCTACKCAAQTI